jgi:hypothetical protein
MMLFKADLHIHTCLSPCAELDMSPKRIMGAAKSCGLNIVGICDHNSCENVPAARRCAERLGLQVIGGMEITSREEVHLLALFGSDTDLFSMQQIVYANLPELTEERYYGDQVVVNEDDEVLDFNKKLLIGATELPLETLVALIHERNGLAIASHVDREGFGIIGQLGFIPPGLPLDALEVASGDPSGIDGAAFPFITSSDAHKLESIGSRFTEFFMDAATIQEIRDSLRGLGDRKVVI